MFKIDLHIHTTLGGDSLIQPQQLVDQARGVGLDAVCVTEHHSYFLSEPLEEVSRNSRFPILRAMEYHAAEGHLLIYGVKAGHTDLPRGLPMQQAVDWVHRRGGVAIPAHPYQRDLLEGSLGDRVLELNGLLALEELNASLSPVENRRASEARHRMGLHGIGGSDAHGPRVLGRAYTQFPSSIHTMEELVLALRRGGYTPCWNGRHFS